MTKPSPQLTTLDAMAAVLRGYETKGGDTSTEWGDLLAEDCVYVDWSFGTLHGREAIEGTVLAPYLAAFADQHHEVHETICDGSRLVIVAQFKGRFVREYAGTPPTGTDVSWPVRDIWTFEDGQVVRIDIASDTLTATRALAPADSGSAAAGEPDSRDR